MTERLIKILVIIAYELATVIFIILMGLLVAR